MNSKFKTKTIITLIAVIFGLLLLTNATNNYPVSAKGGGAETYQQKCATCHGGDGKANTPKGIRKGATDLTKSTISNAQGISVITNGRDSMPGFANTLSAAQIKEVMTFVRGFRK